MIKILLKLWPAFLPLAIFLIWYFKNRPKKDDKIYDVFLEERKKYMFYALVASCLMVIILLLYHGLSEPSQQHIDMQSNQVYNSNAR